MFPGGVPLYSDAGDPSVSPHNSPPLSGPSGEHEGMRTSRAPPRNSHGKIPICYFEGRGLGTFGPESWAVGQT